MSLHAQGSITVRRRPKDGNPGADAVRYWLIPSVSQIKKTDDGKFHPTTVSCEKRKQTGNGTPIATAEGTLKYQIGYTDNSVSTLANYSSAVTVPANCQWIKFILYVSNVDVASETVAVVADGVDVFLLDLDNEMQGIPCNSSGTPTITGTLASTNATVYKGSKVDTGWTFSSENTNCTATIDASTGAVSVTAISADKASVKVIATKGTQTLSATMSLYKVKAGAGGSSPVIYSIEVSASSISRDKSGNITPTSINAYQVKTVGNTSARTNERTLKYQREGQDSSETTLAGQGGEIKDINANCTAIIVTLYNGTTVLDKERIPIVKDGTDGKPGEDVYLLDLDNEVEAIPCNSSGTPTITGTLASTNATVYKGSKVDTGWTFSSENTNCTATIDASTGAVSVTAISADKASVKVIATKGTQTLSATMSLYKAKAGSGGTSPVVYSIETSVSAISRDASGTLSPTSMTAYKNKTVGSTKSRTTDYTLTYQRIGQDANAIILAGQGGTINEISAACTAIELKLKNGDTVLDSERIPIVKDGVKGDDAVRYWLVPSVTEVTKYASGSLSTNSVSCNILKQTGDGTAVACDDLFAIYQTVNTSNQKSTPKQYTRNDAVTVAASTKQVIFELYKIGSVTSGIASGTGAAVDTVTIPVISDGKPGGIGPQGLQGCIVRITEWSAGVEYHNDEELTEGTRYIDIAIVTTGLTTFSAYQCLQTHNSSDSLTTANTSYWQKFNSMAPIYTPMIMAQYAILRIAQANQIQVMKDDGVTVNAAMGGGQFPLWIGANQPQDANFYVDDEGRAFMKDAEIVGRIIAGVSNGQRVELQPDNKSMKIYDSSGMEVSSFEGNSYTSLSSLFSNTSGSFTVNTNKKGSLSIQGSDTNPSNYSSNDYVASSSVYSSTPIEVVVSGYLKTTHSTPPEISSGSSSGASQTGKPQMQKSASANISLYIFTYSDSTLKTLVGTTYITGISGQNSEKTLSSVRAKTSVGGYNVLVVRASVSAYGAGMSAAAYWGSSVSGKADLSATYTSDFYVSRYFANGFCLGQSSTNYIWAYNQGTNGMRFVMENAGYGIDVSNSGIKYKHHSGNWINMPMLVFRGRATNYTSNNNITYSWSNSLSYNGTNPTLERLAEGQIKVTFPTTWINAGISPSSCVINVVGYGQINGSSDNPAKAQIYDIGSNYVTVTLSDDASENDAGFLLNIFT